MVFWQVECMPTCGVSKPEERTAILNSEEVEGEEEDEDEEVKVVVVVVVVGALLEEVSKTGWGGEEEGEGEEEEGVVVGVTGIKGFK